MSILSLRFIAEYVEGTSFYCLNAQSFYAAHLDFSSFGSSEAKSDWDLRRTPSLKKGLLKHLDADLPGITKPYTYIGSQFSTFCWHVEDDCLYSINYNHGGDPKVWYGVSAQQKSSFEQVYAKLFPSIASRHGLKLPCAHT